MELDELKQAWHAMEQRLDRQQALNVQLLTESRIDKAKRHLRWLLLGQCAQLALGLLVTVLAARFWLEAWENRWVSDTMWRARMWIPYSSMPIGLTILALQFVADLYALVTGREPPFGMKA